MKAKKFLFNPIHAGWGRLEPYRLGVGQIVPPPPSISPLFVVQLQPNLAWWYSETKTLKSYKKFADIITRR